MIVRENFQNCFAYPIYEYRIIYHGVYKYEARLGDGILTDEGVRKVDTQQRRRKNGRTYRFQYECTSISIADESVNN